MGQQLQEEKNLLWSLSLANWGFHFSMLFFGFLPLFFFFSTSPPPPPSPSFFFVLDAKGPMKPGKCKAMKLGTWLFRLDSKKEKESGRRVTCS